MNHIRRIGMPIAALALVFSVLGAPAADAMPRPKPSTVTRALTVTRDHLSLPADQVPAAATDRRTAEAAADGRPTAPETVDLAAGATVQFAEAELTEDVGVAGVTLPEAAPGVEIYVRQVDDGVPTTWTRLELDHAVDGESSGTEPVIVTQSAGVDSTTVQVATVSTAAVAAQLSVVSTATTAADAAASQLAWSNPEIRSRAAWGANESLVQNPYTYAKVTGAMVHHTAGTNSYTPEQVPSILRAIQEYHVNSRGWNDIAYNVLVDKFGRAWEGRGGRVDRPVQGGHAYGVTNARVFGISLMGDFESVDPTQSMIDTTARVIAWKFRLHGVDPNVATWGSGGQDGGSIHLKAISMHRDENATDCPGSKVAARIPEIRSQVVRLLSSDYPDPGLVGFDPGNIIGDAEFYDRGALNALDIKNFIEGKGVDCVNAPDGTPCLKNYRGDVPAMAATSYCDAIQARTGYAPWDMIADVSRACGVSPKVLLVLLQKEQGLVTASGTGLTAARYERATGVGCPDGAACDPAYAGFFRQVYGAAERFERYRLDGADYRYKVGQNSIQFHPNLLCGTASVTIANQATAGLYNYTPYVPNAAALATATGSGDSCSSYGNRNFYRYMRLWFPDSVSKSGAAPIQATPIISNQLFAMSGTGTVRLAGANRYATAAAISSSIAPAYHGAVYLARADSFPDALAAGPVAYANGAPILLVGQNTVPDAVRAELARLKPSKIIAIGGDAAISAGALDAAKAAAGGVPTERIQGANRYETAANLAGDARPGTIYIVSGQGFADALATGPAAARSQSRILLTAQGDLPAATRARLIDLKPTRVVVVGGTAAVSQNVFDQVKSALPGTSVQRVAGADRYATAAEVAKASWGSGAERVFLASGEQFPDALSGTPAAAASDAPLLLTRSTCRPQATSATLSAFKPALTVILGGTAAVSDDPRTC